MSMYNLLFGSNKLGPFYLAILGLEKEETGRFRDCFLTKTDGGEDRIVIYTRNGGGNREDYEEVTAALRAHPQFVTDFDDDYDCTYASYVFKVPDHFAQAVRALAEKTPDQHIDPGARYQDLLAKMQAGKNDDPQVARALQVGQQILEPIIKALNGREEKKS